MRNISNLLKYNWPSLTWAAFILVVCLLPGRDLPSVSLWQADKIGHFGVYLLLSVLMYWGWTKQTTYNALRSKTFLKILVITTCYGFAVELMQGWLTADRRFDMLDALANTIGAVAGSLISVKLFKPAQNIS